MITNCSMQATVKSWNAGAGFSPSAPTYKPISNRASLTANGAVLPIGNSSKLTNILGTWQALRDAAPTTWEIGYRRLRFQLELTRFKHLGLFPEQRSNWDFIAERLPAEGRFLNLFAYTGAASCMARQTGAETLHVDSIKQLLTWAHTNMERSGLADIKWVREDALKFVERELKRGRHYQGIIMDPPAWGLGAKGEKWKLDNKLEALLEGVQGLLAQNGFLILNTYSPTIGLAEITRLAHQYFRPQDCEIRELWMQTSTGKELYYGNLLRVSG